MEQSKEPPELVLSADDINAFIAGKSTGGKPLPDSLMTEIKGGRITIKPRVSR